MTVEDRGELMRMVERMVALWDSHKDRPWNTLSERAVVVPPLNACVAQVVELSRGILTLYNAGQEFAAMPLIRASIESAVTAVWLAASGEAASRSLMLEGAKQRRTVLQEVARFGRVDVTKATQETHDALRALKGAGTEEGRTLRARFEALPGGDDLYVHYRLASGMCHPSVALTDVFTETTEQTPSNPLGLVLLVVPDHDARQATAWLGSHACMLLIALTAADHVLTKPQHRTQLDKWARRIGITPVIRRLDDAPDASGDETTTLPGA